MPCQIPMCTKEIQAKNTNPLRNEIKLLLNYQYTLESPSLNLQRWLFDNFVKSTLVVSIIIFKKSNSSLFKAIDITSLVLMQEGGLYKIVVKLKNIIFYLYLFDLMMVPFRTAYTFFE